MVGVGVVVGMVGLRMDTVVVNGRLAVRQGRYTGELAGRVLRS